MLKLGSIVRTAFFQAGRIKEIIDGTSRNWSSAIYFRVNICEPRVDRPSHIISLEEVRDIITEEEYQAAKAARVAKGLDE